MAKATIIKKNNNNLRDRKWKHLNLYQKAIPTKNSTSEMLNS